MNNYYYYPCYLIPIYSVQDLMFLYSSIPRVWRDIILPLNNCALPKYVLSKPLNSGLQADILWNFHVCLVVLFSCMEIFCD